MSMWLLTTAATMTFFMLMVLAIRGAAMRALGARSSYLLWLLVPLRMVTPSLPERFVPTLQPLRAITATADRWIVSSTPVSIGYSAGATLMSAGLTIWLIGAVLFLSWQVVRYVRFLRTAAPICAASRRCRGISISVADVDGPLAGGVLRRFVLLPLDFSSRFSPGQQRLVLRHEFEHHRRCDLYANLLAIVVLAAHWWNPVAYLAYRAFRQDQELACDAAVLAGTTAVERRAYANAIVAAAGVNLSATCAWNHHGGLAERLKRLPHTNERASTRPIGAASAAVVSATLLLGSATPISNAAVDAVKVVQKQLTVALIASQPLISLPNEEHDEAPRARATKPILTRPRRSAAIAAISMPEAPAFEEAKPCPADDPPGAPCEREKFRIGSLRILQERVASDASLNSETRSRMLTDIAEEIIHTSPGAVLD